MQSDIKIEPAALSDVQELTEIMTRAFNDDSRRHLGKDQGGPPGYNTGEFIRQNAFHSGGKAFKALLKDRIAGCIIVFPAKDGHHHLGCMFTDPAHQRKGIGKTLFDYVELTLPGKSWTLETPAFARSNHRFYEDRCGFTKIRETPPDDEPGVQYVYRKEYQKRHETGNVT